MTAMAGVAKDAQILCYGSKLIDPTKKALIGHLHGVFFWSVASLQK
jgi:hypothetical protein